MAGKKPVGEITRGTTNPNRLRRVDRYLTELDIWKKIEAPLAVDLGYGKTPVTALELLGRIQKVNSSARVLGVEIDPARVNDALPLQTESLRFVHGGFEIPIPDTLGPRTDVDLIRAFNVLRQYEENEVAATWGLMQSRLSDKGLIVEGTCDEIGRVASWITIDKQAPRYFTISLRLTDLSAPSKVAERLPKMLIHKNTKGNKIHDFLTDLDSAWSKSASFSTFGPSQHFAQAIRLLIESGWPVLEQPKRWKIGELTINYQAIAP